MAENVDSVVGERCAPCGRSRGPGNLSTAVNLLHDDALSAIVMAVNPAGFVCGGSSMPKARRHVALGRIGLVVGMFALAGCVSTESAYDEAYGGSSYLGYDPYWTPPLQYGHGSPGYAGYPGDYGYYGYPGYSAYPRHYVYSPGYYSYQRYYGPTLYPPPPGHARRDRDRDDDRYRHPGDRPPRDGDDRYGGHRFDRDGDEGSRGDRGRRGGNASPPAVERQPRSGSGSRRPPPEFVPTEGAGADAPTPRRRGRREPVREVPE